VPNATSLRWLLAALAGWLDQRQQQVVACLTEENRLLDLVGRFAGRPRLGGVLNYYEGAA
jgi:hypothetical protein